MNAKLIKKIFFLLIFSAGWIFPAYSAQPHQHTSPIFDDKSLLDGYTKRYEEKSQDVLIAMIRDDALESYKTAAAVRAFYKKFGQLVFSTEKRRIERWLIRRLARTDSIFVEIEIMHALCMMDRYKYFNSMMPNLLRRLDHYNPAANELAYQYINAIIRSGQNRAREARVIFNNLRRILFLSRRDLQGITEPDDRLKQKLDLLRWAIKILGTSELRRLPSEVLHLL